MSTCEGSQVQVYIRLGSTGGFGFQGPPLPGSCWTSSLTLKLITFTVIFILHMTFIFFSQMQVYYHSVLLVPSRVCSFFFSNLNWGETALHCGGKNIYERVALLVACRFRHHWDNEIWSRKSIFVSLEVYPKTEGRIFQLWRVITASIIQSFIVTFDKQWK